MERILLIEDDQALGRGTALALAGEGREIRVAATLAQGWAALGEGEYALVLLDLNLPDGNGLDFLTALRRTSGVPVLILTANDLESDQVAGLELGADDYVTKPFSLAVLRARVNRLLRRGSWCTVPAAAPTPRRPRWSWGPFPSTLSACALCGTGRRWSCPRRSSGCCTCWWSTGGRP